MHHFVTISWYKPSGNFPINVVFLKLSIKSLNFIKHKHFHYMLLQIPGTFGANVEMCQIPVLRKEAFRRIHFPKLSTFNYVFPQNC